MKLSAEHKKHVGQSIKKLNLHWQNNGIDEIKSQVCPTGYKPGRLKSFGGIMVKLKFFRLNAQKDLFMDVLKRNKKYTISIVIMYNLFIKMKVKL